MIKMCDPEWILADILAEIPEAPATMVTRSLMRAVRQFSKSCMYAVWLRIPVQENVLHYPFERYMPEGFSVQYVTDVSYNGCCLECVDEDCNSKCTSGYTLDDMSQISLVGYCPGDNSDPECQDELKVKVVLRPDPDTCQVPCDMLEQFEEELKDGALGFLLSMQGKPWSNTRAGEFYENRFLGGIASAKCLISNKMNPTDNITPGECLL